MRSFLFFLLALMAWSVPSSAFSQQAPEIKRVQVGFQTHQSQEHTAYKVGLWTPVNVEVFGGTDGIEANLEIETVDSDDVGTRIRVPVRVKANESRDFIGYVKTGRIGRSGNEVRVTLRANGLDYVAKGVVPNWSIDIDTHLYLTLGAKITDLHRAVRSMDKQSDEKLIDDVRIDPGMFRHVVFEDNVERLPEAWFGYNGIDLIVLSTGNEKFLTKLKSRPQQLKALAQWVRRGGRLVVAIARTNQQQTADLLAASAWDPPIPVVPPSSAGKASELAFKILPVTHWGGAQDFPFQRLDPATQKSLPIAVARLDDGNAHAGNWEVLAHSGDDFGKHPLIAQVRYGLGQITYLAFSFEEVSFAEWAGKEQFLQTMVRKLAPKAPGHFADKAGTAPRRHEVNDLTTDLLAKLDDFDVTALPFGYVAFFIVLYILIVGPLDFLLLKYGVKRLEWTWLTFPVVVLAISVIGYVTAVGLKGRELKINKIDIVDFDMRTSADPTNVHAYGQSFFTLLSPSIQTYTIGLEPNPAFWGEKDNKVRSVDLLAWMGRPSGGPNEMGRSGAANFFRKPYDFRADAAGLEGVPIPIWTTKAFTASWEQTLKAPPLVVDLTYHTKVHRGKDLRITGTLANRLGVDLIDVWLIYDDRYFPIPDGLKSGALPQTVALPGPAGEHMSTWVDPSRVKDDAPPPRAWLSDPTNLVKRMLFHEAIDTQNVVRNHSLRSLDLGWRIQEERRDLTNDRRIREAILFARVPHVHGNAEAVTKSTQLPLPTKLWLGTSPAEGLSRPELSGELNQDTYIRVILSLRPTDE